MSRNNFQVFSPPCLVAVVVTGISAQQLREVLVQRDPAGLTPQLETRIIEATELTMQRKSTDG